LQYRITTWLYRIATNEALKLTKQKKTKHQFQEYDEVHSDSISLIPDLIAPEEQRSKIDEALQYLKPKEALVLKLYYLHELSIRDISASTGFTVANVKVLLHRSRKSFAQVYHK